MAFPWQIRGICGIVADLPQRCHAEFTRKGLAIRVLQLMWHKKVAWHATRG